MQFVFTSEWPVTGLNVMRGGHASMVRAPYLPHSPDQRFPLHEAVRSYTVEGVDAEHAENLNCKPNVGMLANIVMLFFDVEAVPTSDIASIGSIVTICGGKMTFKTTR